MEEQQKTRGKVWKWILAVLTVLILLGVGAYVFLFRVNQFSLSLELEGEDKLYLEYGQAYTEPGYKAVLYGTHLLKNGKILEDAAVQVMDNLHADKLGKYTVTYAAQWEWLQASARRTVWVVDTQNPVITLVESEQPLLAGTP